MELDFGYEEIPHTADWALRVWAGDLPTLFRAAAKGMNSLSGLVLAREGRVRRSIELTAPDAESLLVAFLSELVYSAEQENLGFDDFDIHLELAEANTYWLRAKISGAPIESISKTIKAVTFHNLQIRGTERGLEVEIVFDV